MATDKDGNILANLILRDIDKILKVPPHQVDYVQLSPVQVISVATSLIPFLEHDANRALMAQICSDKLFHCSDQNVLGWYRSRTQVARDLEQVPITKVNGTVSYCVVEDDDGNEHFHYLQKYQRSNQDTCQTNDQ